MESIQYKACLAITGTIRGTSKEKTYQELVATTSLLIQKTVSVL